MCWWGPHAISTSQQASWLLLEAGRGWPWGPHSHPYVEWAVDLVKIFRAMGNSFPATTHQVTPLAPSRLGNKRDTEGTEDA